MLKTDTEVFYRGHRRHLQNVSTRVHTVLRYAKPGVWLAD